MIKLLPLLFLLTGCLNNDSGEVSSGGGYSPAVNHELSGKLLTAFNLVKDRYDFSTVNIRYGDALGNWMVYYYDTQTIVASERVVNSQPDTENACTLVHELAHHNGAGQPEAIIAGDECRRVL